MEKVLYLCFACAADLEVGYELEELPGTFESSRCERCARKVWGATYKITPKRAKK
nr:MAG TPA: hypothetical protein [Caudoviricetes sp.]